jgi:hypothetical protein
MDGLEIQFLLNPAFDLEKSFGAFLNRLDGRLKPHGLPAPTAVRPGS